MAKQLTWRKAIEKVLSEASGAMHYKDLTDKIIEAGLRTDLGATPVATVSAHLTTAIKNEGSECPWQKIGRGTLRNGRTTCISSSTMPVS